jgi:hypothetical protein
MTNNLLIEDPSTEDQGHGNRQIHVLQILQSTSFSIHRNRGLSVSKSALYKSLCAKARIVAELS